MRCSIIRKLLSTYCNDEVTSTQKRLAEEHIADCADCRAMVEGYEKVSNQLVSLRIMPMKPNIKKAVMSQIRS